MMMDYHESYWVVTEFYISCLRFHMREGREPLEAHQWAYKDIEHIKHEPFSPHGKELNQQAVEDVKKLVLTYQNR